MKSIIFCHGLESAPHGAKFRALQAAGLEPMAPDFRDMRLGERVRMLLGILRDRDDSPVLVGSSYGGITALCAAIVHHDTGGEVGDIILCAPALNRAESPADSMALAPPAPTTIVHGSHDEVVPIDVSLAWVDKNPGATLIEVDDDHRLGRSLGLIARLAGRAANKGV